MTKGQGLEGIVLSRPEDGERESLKKQDLERDAQLRRMEEGL